MPATTGTSDIALFWAGSALELKVSASELWVNLTVGFETYEPWVLIEINGALIARQMLDRGSQRLCLFRNFDPSLVHTVRLIKDTQAMSDDFAHHLIINGLEAADAEFFPVPERKYRFEFIGDSITSGEGLRGAGEEMQWVTPWMSTIGHYGVETAKAFDADYRLISQGGWGVVSGWDGNLEHIIPSIYRKTCGLIDGDMNRRMGAQDDHDFSSWKPDVIVINLGTNDVISFITGVSKATRADFEQKAYEFIKMIRECNPDSYIIWIYGMMEITLSREINDAISRFCRETGDMRTAFLPAISATPETFGSREHPGPIVHQMAANLLISYISQILK